MSSLGDLKPGFEVDVAVHVHTKAGPMRAQKKEGRRCQDMKAERQERKEERRCVRGEKRKGGTKWRGPEQMKPNLIRKT